MTVSRTVKGLSWLALAVASLAVYVVLVLTCDLGNPWKFFGATQLRAFVPAVALFLVGSDLMRFVHAKRQLKSRVEVEAHSPSSSPSTTPPPTPQPPPTPTPQPPPTPQPTPTPTPSPGEALFAQARAMPHRKIPDFEFDGEYLNLLGKSAATGYAPALAKLGEYAMRRAAWVEAYYWMSMAKRQGMHGLGYVMRAIRKNWSLDNFPDENGNVNALFTFEAGSVGRALLHVDSGREAARAKEFLRANHPEFLS